ncbi:MAG TPA: response regulator, partial [Dongiaceae bacterium]|nr:response regulator [Dongiaceae bacterium]
PLILHANPADQNLLADLLDGRLLPLITKPLCQQKAYDLLGGLINTDTFLNHRGYSEVEQKRVNRIGQQRLRVIAVDDNAANLKLLSALLEDLDVLVTACDSGIKALQHIEQREFDLVLMDIQMPVMDGVETARRIRIMEKGERRTPIIAVTAHALASEKHQLLNSGMDDYVTKPINESQLIHIIHKWTGVNLHQKKNERGGDITEFGRNGAAVDMQLGIKLANGKADLAEEMLDMLFTSLQKDKSQITDRLIEEDYGALLEVVHKLHGATRYTGVPKLQKCSFTLEEALKLQRYEQVPDLTADLMLAIDQVVGWYVENRVPMRQLPAGQS